MSLSHLLTHQWLATSFQDWVYPERCISTCLTTIFLLTWLWEAQRYFHSVIRSKCPLLQSNVSQDGGDHLHQSLLRGVLRSHLLHLTGKSEFLWYTLESAYSQDPSDHSNDQESVSGPLLTV